MKILKKFCYIFIIMVSLIFACPSASAYTLDDVINKAKEGELYKYFDDFGIKLNMTNSNNSLSVTYDGTKFSKGVYTTIFDFQNGILSYKYMGSKEVNEEIINQVDSDGIAVSLILSAVYELNGYDPEKLDEIIKKEDYTFDKNGLEIIMWEYEYNDGIFSEKGTVYDTFKIDINNLNLGDKVNKDETNKEVLIESPTTINKDQTIPNNPKTGSFCSLIALSGLGIISLICLVISSKNKKFNKI